MGSPELGIDTTATFSAWIYPRNGNGVIAMQGFRHQGNEYGWVVAIGWDSWSGSETDERELVWASHDNSYNANNSMTAASPALITLLQVKMMERSIMPTGMMEAKAPHLQHN